MELVQAVQAMIDEAIRDSYYTSADNPRVMLRIDQLFELGLASAESVERLHHKIAAFNAANPEPDGVEP